MASEQRRCHQHGDGSSPIPARILKSKLAKWPLSVAGVLSEPQVQTILRCGSIAISKSQIPTRSPAKFPQVGKESSTRCTVGCQDDGQNCGCNVRHFAVMMLGHELIFAPPLGLH
jgi:hypothetical protein